jgi:hypothetical protein
MRGAIRTLFDFRGGHHLDAEVIGLVRHLA